MSRISAEQKVFFWVSATLAQIILYMLAPSHISLGSLAIDLSRGSYTQLALLCLSLSMVLKAIQSYINGSSLKSLPIWEKRRWLGRILGITTSEIKPNAKKSTSLPKFREFAWKLVDDEDFGSWLTTDDPLFPIDVVYINYNKAKSYCVLHVSTLSKLQMFAQHYKPEYEIVTFNIAGMYKTIEELENNKEILDK